MAKSAQEIVQEIIAHIQKEGSSYSSWYVGIASDPESRLFSDHGVSKDNGWWIYQDAGNEENARAIEKYILENYRTAGGSGGGDYTTKFVYAYKKTSTTNP